MTFIICTSDQSKSAQPAGMIQAFGHAAQVAGDVNDAVCTQWNDTIDCLLIGRKLICNYRDFLAWCPCAWFVPVSDVMDNIDVINALNTHWSAYYKARRSPISRSSECSTACKHA